ncbi:MAG: 4-hydroxy-tetrahydrodipicolinate synthase [Lachnospirales bacterium]
MKPLFTGSGVAIVTPFTDDNKIDFESFGKHIDFLIENSTDAIVVCGTTGEAATMTEEEHIATVKYCVEKVNGRVPVISGTGSNNTAKTIKMSKACEEVGVDGLLVVTPYYNKATKKGLVKHFTEIHNSTTKPIILYNVPGRTNVNLSVEVVKELNKLDRIAGVKEASGDLSQVVRIHQNCPELPIYSGNDDQITTVCAAGGVGVITVLGNVAPRQTHDIVAEFLNGNHSQSLKLQCEMLDLCSALFSEVNPIPVKTALCEMGFNNGFMRLPLCEMEDNAKEVLLCELKKVLG